VAFAVLSENPHIAARTPQAPIPPGIGHHVPQEAPDATIAALLALIESGAGS
jgi:hypothetical protein